MQNCRKKSSECKKTLEGKGWRFTIFLKFFVETWVFGEKLFQQKNKVKQARFKKIIEKIF